MIDQSKVKNVILDLGGVLVDIDPELTVNALQRIVQPHLVHTLRWDEIPEVVYAMETGKWDKRKFMEHFNQVCKTDVIEEEIVDAWCAMVLEFPHQRVEMVKLLAEKYNVYLLSNTNAIHIKYFEKEFKNRYNFSLHKLFTNVYYSSEIGLRKPEVECFNHVLNHAGIKPEETIMVDDMEINCMGAEAAGLQSLKVPDNSGLEAVFEQLI
jgi:glucose-1-phosphatase